MVRRIITTQEGNNHIKRFGGIILFTCFLTLLVNKITGNLNDDRPS